MSEEKWQLIPNFSHYLVSTDGNVRHINSIVNRKLNYNKRYNYYQVMIKRDDGIIKNLSVARLVASVFIPKPEGVDDSKLRVKHMESVTDNNVNNLRWEVKK